MIKFLPFLLLDYVIKYCFSIVVAAAAAAPSSSTRRSGCPASRSLLQHLPQSPLGTRLQNATRLMRQHQWAGTRPAAAKVQTARALLWGGGCLGVGVAARSWWTSRALAHCEANRLAGVIQHTLQQDADKNFDWKRLWTYLEPHTWELIGAILVSTAAALAAVHPLVIAVIAGSSNRGLHKYPHTQSAGGSGQ